MAEKYISREEKQRRASRKKWRRRATGAALIAFGGWGAVNYYLPSLALDQRAATAFENAANEYLYWDEIKRTTNVVLMRDFERPQFGVDDTLQGTTVEIMGQQAQSNLFGPISDRWYAMMGRHDVLMQNPEYKREFSQWLSQLDAYKNNKLVTVSVEERARAVDALVDSTITYQYDSQNYEAFDYWASPLETIRRGAGDCDDFAILKYYALRYLDVNPDRLYMVAVSPEGSDNINHATLIVDIAGYSLWDQMTALMPGVELTPEFIVIDNDNSLQGRTIEAGDSGYDAHYAMNETGYWTVLKDVKLIP